MVARRSLRFALRAGLSLVVYAVMLIARLSATSSRTFSLGRKAPELPASRLPRRTPVYDTGGLGSLGGTFTGSACPHHEVAWRLTAGGLVTALLTSLRAYGGGYRGDYGGGYRGGGGDRGRQTPQQQMQMREAKRQREASQFFMYQARLIRTGAPPRDDLYWAREERMLFSGGQMTKGINFDQYDKVEVERRGGFGSEVVCESFDDICSKFTMSEDLVTNILDRCKYDKPTPVQKHAVSAALSGVDTMVSAQTGSGKTAAFLIPLIAEVLRAGRQPLQEGPVKPTGVVLSPTRELCQQIAVEARKLCFRTDVRSAAIYGGADALPQLKALAEGAELVICTPGRLEDFLERGVVSMENVKYLVLDEADRMLDMGFEPQIRAIVEGHRMPESGENGRQTMMFSATFPREMQDLALDFLDPTYLWVEVGKVGEACENIEQRFQDTSTTDIDGKFDMLIDCVREVRSPEGELGKTLVFANSKATVDDVCWKLSDARIRSMQIHGGLTQSARDRALNDFRNGRVAVLVATDVAARGLDLPGVDHVVNYELPQNAEDYTHRIGRTGRIGNTGIATSMVGSWEPALKDIVKTMKGKDVVLPQWLEIQGQSSAGSMRRYGDGGGRGRFDSNSGGGGYGRSRGGGYGDRDGYGDGGYGRSQGGRGRYNDYGDDNYGSDFRRGGGNRYNDDYGGRSRSRYNDDDYGGRGRSRFDDDDYGDKGRSRGYGRNDDGERGGGGRGRGRRGGSFGGARSAPPQGGRRDGYVDDTPPWARGLPPRQRTY
eukprot:TRINITY_DN93879_c0_g1_i1.p1 TRINITY_DN93879_c0_g1~~TRINITY_DN93879_c0_g1_i1.p1  ORF type:complete len:787 (+),score=154.51 TRINITY_DN93879_c0_g1_i1:44-2362(+)